VSFLLRRFPATFGSVCLALAAAAAPAAQGPPATPPAPKPPVSGSLDAFMAKVLARREVNRKTLNDYILDETETFEILGPGRYRLHRNKREFTWYVRDGMHVRSPVKFDGVTVDADAREKYEASWIRREKERQERAAKKEKPKGEISVGTGVGVQIETGATPIPTEPRFVSEAYFMDFKFEPGNYYLAGREQLEGHEVLRIEYYPTHLFDDDDKKTPKEMRKDSKAQQREDKLEQDIDRKMNKTALVTLWVDPSEHQIVKYTFDNVWMDFLPGAWLVRVDDIRASMTMGQPFPGVWLPRAMNIHAGITLANGSFEAGYGRTFDEYREANVKTTIRVPKRVAAMTVPLPPPLRWPAWSSNRMEEETGGAGPFVRLEEDPQAEIVREVRVHGNASLTDEEVLKLAGIELNVALSADAVTAIAERLKASGRFETVEVRKRLRSLDDPTDVALVLVVHERPGVRSGAGNTNPGLSPFSRLKSQLMFLPIVGYTDGYGFTYGARLSTVDLLGFGERLSVPLTWGGTRRAAIEFERSFKTGPLTRVTSTFGIWNRENPHYEIRDQRVELKARAERDFAHVFRVGVDASQSTVSFGAIDDRLWTLGVNAAIDTRSDPAFPGNAVYLGGGWNGLNVKDHPRVNRYTADARGYLRLVGQSVLAGRAQYFTSDATLPPYERLLLGGASNLRGFRAGAFDADRMLVTSAEVRVPITSVISGAKLGLMAFMDAARATDFGASLKDADWRRGAGGGIFIIAPMVSITLHVAHGLDGGGTRVHLASGFSF
jgi:hypothetical protein